MCDSFLDSDCKYLRRRQKFFRYHHNVSMIFYRCIELSETIFYLLFEDIEDSEELIRSNNK